MPLTLDQISEYLRKAAEQAGQVTQEASDKKIGEKVLDEIAAQSESIQSAINKFLGNVGLVTQEEIDKQEQQDQLHLQRDKIFFHLCFHFQCFPIVVLVLFQAKVEFFSCLHEHSLRP